MIAFTVQLNSLNLITILLTYIYIYYGIIQLVQKKQQYSCRAFSIAGPTVWNSLPDEVRDPACGSNSFKQFLKTILFSLY